MGSRVGLSIFFEENANGGVAEEEYAGDDSVVKAGESSPEEKEQSKEQEAFPESLVDLRWVSRMQEGPQFIHAAPILLEECDNLRAMLEVHWNFDGLAALANVILV